MGQTISEVNNNINKQGYIWIGDKSEYTNIRSSKLTVKCDSCGEISKNKSLRHLSSWSCKCKKFDFKKTLSDNNWYYISGEYSGAKNKSIITCKCKKCGEQTNKKYSSYKNGCKNCANKKLIKYNNETIHQHINTSHKLVKFENNRLHLICKICSYKWNSNIYDYISKNRECGRCIGNAPIDVAELLKSISVEHYKLVSNSNDIKNCNTKIKVICSAGHNCIISRHSWKSGYRCNTCAKLKSRSKMEIEFASFFKDRNIETNYRTNNKHEIDILFKDHNIGVEMHGVFYHSSRNVGDRYHINKYQFYNNLGVTLIQIFEHEWNANKQYYIDLVNDLIANGLKKQTEQVFTQDNRFPIYDTSNYAQSYNIEPKEITFKKHKFYDAGHTVFKMI